MSADSTNADDPSDVSRTLLLNGLRDVVLGTNTVVEGETRHRLERSFHDATSSGERGAFVTALHAIEEAETDTVDDTTHEILQTTVDGVINHLDSSDTTLTAHHESGTDIPPRDVALYNFWQTRNPSELDRLSCSRPTQDAIETGASAAANGAFRDAIAAFDRGVDASSSTDEAVASRVLAALAAHWAADDDRAMDYAEEALQLQSDAWPATMVAAVVDDPMSHAYREGSLAVQAYLRVRARVPDDASLSVRLGRGEQGETVWKDAAESLDCVPMRRLAPHVRASFELTGPAARLPILDAYYFALGTVEPESEVPRTTDYILFDGPLTGNATEELYIDGTSF